MRPIATSKTTTSTSTTTTRTLTSTTATTFTALRRCIAGKMHLQLLCSIFLCCNNINNITFTGGQSRGERLVKTGSSGAKGIHACDSSRAPGSRGWVWVWGWGWICEDWGSGRVMIPHFVAPTVLCCYLCFCIFLSFFFFVFLESWKVGKQPWQETAFFTWSIKKRGKTCIINTKRKMHEC